MIQGDIGQVQGPLTSGQEIEDLADKTIKFGITIDEKDYMENPNFFFEVHMVGENMNIVKQQIKIGNTFTYENDDSLPIKKMIFPIGAPASLLMDYVILEN